MSKLKEPPDETTQGQVTEQLGTGELSEETQTQTTPEEQSQGSTEEASQEEYSPSELANQFLEAVEENDRPIVSKYINQWDAGVTRRFQDLRNQLQPYEELGAEPDALEEAWYLYQTLEENPKAVYDAMLANPLIAQQLGLESPQTQPQQKPDNGSQGQKPPSEELQGQLPPEFQQQFEKNNRVLEALAEYVLQDEERKKQEQEDQQLDEYIGLLKQEFGDFDEDYVLVKMYNGMDAEGAVKEWQNKVQSLVNESQQRTKNAPPVLSSSGGNGVPQEQPQSLAQIDRNDVKSLVANVLAQTQKEAGG